jgi:hypothetical protein
LGCFLIVTPMNINDIVNRRTESERGPICAYSRIEHFAIRAKLVDVIGFELIKVAERRTSSVVTLNEEHTTPPFSFAKTEFIQSSLTSRENFCFGFQLNDLQPLRS